MIKDILEIIWYTILGVSPAILVIAICYLVRWIYQQGKLTSHEKEAWLWRIENKGTGKGEEN